MVVCRRSCVAGQVVKNDKHFMDQSLDEIKLLLYLNNAGDCDEKHIVQMYDYFYYKEHLIIVTEVRSFPRPHPHGGGAPLLVPAPCEVVFALLCP